MTRRNTHCGEQRGASSRQPGVVLGTYLGNSHGPDFLDVDHAVVPGHQALHVDVELVPQSQDGFVVLLNPRKPMGNMLSLAFKLSRVPYGKPGHDHTRN